MNFFRLIVRDAENRTRVIRTFTLLTFCRAAGNRTRSVPTPWARTAGILQPVYIKKLLWQVRTYYHCTTPRFLIFYYLLSGRRDSNPESHEPESCILPLYYIPVKSLLGQVVNVTVTPRPDTKQYRVFLAKIQLVGLQGVSFTSHLVATRLGLGTASRFGLLAS